MSYGTLKTDETPMNYTICLCKRKCNLRIEKLISFILQVTKELEKRTAWCTGRNSVSLSTPHTGDG